jgi:hypothetical protein
MKDLLKLLILLGVISTPDHSYAEWSLNYNCEAIGIAAKIKESTIPFYFWKDQFESGPRKISTLKSEQQRILIDYNYKKETHGANMRRNAREYASNGLSADTSMKLIEIDSKNSLKEIELLESFYASINTEIKKIQKCMAFVEKKFGENIQEKCDFQFNRAKEAGHTNEQILTFLKEKNLCGY